jgi:hypothetical protein
LRDSPGSGQLRPLLIWCLKLELKNRFSALDNTDTEDNVQEKWNTIKKTYVEAAVNTIGYIIKKNKEWLTSETW